MTGVWKLLQQSRPSRSCHGPKHSAIKPLLSQTNTHGGRLGWKWSDTIYIQNFCSPWFGFCISVQDQNWLSEVLSAVNGLQLEGGIEHGVKGLFYNLSLLWLVVAKHCLGIKGDDHIRIAQSGVV